MKRKSLQRNIEIGGFLAIVISLILLAYETRQNTLAIQASALQQHFEQHITLVSAGLQNEQLRDAETKGLSGLEDLGIAETNLFVPYNWNIMRSNIVAFELKRSGMLPESQWRTFEAALARRLRRSQGARELWSIRKKEFTEEFQALVDGMIETADEIHTF
jgi:hypothetical protein